MSATRMIVELQPSKKLRSVRIGYSAGGLGIHRDLDFRSRWCVSHLQSGLKLHAGSLLYRQARRLLDSALLVGRHVGLSFDQPSDALLQAMQACAMGVRAWRRFVDESTEKPRKHSAAAIAERWLRHNLPHLTAPCAHCTWYADRGLDDPPESFPDQTGICGADEGRTRYLNAIF